jgi:MFS family permease
MRWPVRYNIVGLLTLGAMINYIDRVNISVAAPDIMRATGWDKAQFGAVFSAFLVGYALLQFPGGALADRWSPRKVLAFSCLGFSLFTVLTPLGQHTFLLLLTLRTQKIGGGDADGHQGERLRIYRAQPRAAL